MIHSIIKPLIIQYNIESKNAECIRLVKRIRMFKLNNQFNFRDQRKLEEKRREELLRSTVVSSSPDHVQICLENDQSELRHYNRMNRTNNGKIKINTKIPKS